jgi:hypothetical protein
LQCNSKRDKERTARGDSSDDRPQIFDNHSSDGNDSNSGVVCRNRKFLADRAIELSYAEGTNAASFNEIRKKEAVK